jgi:hypothetical protein
VNPDDPIAGPDAYPEAPHDPSDPMVEPDDGLGHDGSGLVSWADMRECARLGITPGAFRRQRERELEEWRAAWRAMVGATRGERR